MKYFRVKYKDGSFDIIGAKNMLEVITKKDLASDEHANTHIVQLSGEQKAIAMANAQEGL